MIIELEPYVPDLEKPPAIICDIDGTLAHATRDYHDYSLVHTDALDTKVRDLLDREWACGYDIIILTGRPVTCRKDTYRWLVDNHVPVDALLMSPPRSEDYIAKYDLFNKYVRAEYNVEYVLDDRDRVVEMWRKLGLKTFQVAEGNF